MLGFVWVWRLGSGYFSTFLPVLKITQHSGLELWLELLVLSPNCCVTLEKWLGLSFPEYK